MLVTRMVIDAEHPEGIYNGPRFTATVELLAEHFRGDVLPLGTVCGNATFRDDNDCKRHGIDRVHMLGYDVDDNAPTRLRILATILIARGCDERSLLGTPGSKPWKGKLLAYWSRTQQGAALRAFGAEVLAEARRHSEWGREPCGPKDPVTVEMRPEEGEGGILRIGGRHPGRGGPLERFFHPLTGEALAFAQVIPSTMNLPRLRTTIAVARRHRTVDKILENGIDWTGGTIAVRRIVNRLANEAHRTAGAAAGETLFLGWMRTLKANSPALNTPSPKNRDKRHPLAPARAKAVWAHALAKSGQSVTLNNLPTGDASRGLFNVTRTILNTLETYVRRNGLNPGCFGLTYERLTDALGLDVEYRMQTWRLVKRLAESGQLVILDPGIARGTGDSAATMYSIPHLDPKSAAKAKQHPAYIKRLALRAEHEKRVAAKAAGKLTLIRPDVVEPEPVEVASAPIAVKPARRTVFIHTPLAITVLSRPCTPESVRAAANVAMPMRC